MLLASINLVSDSTEATTVPVTLTFQNHSLNVRALIDTGALHANYISEETARAFKALGAKPVNSRVRVCSAFKGKCNSASEKLALFVTITNEVTNELETDVLEFTVIETDYDMIIGRPSILAQNLVYKLLLQFTYAPMSLPSNVLVPPACDQSCLGPDKACNPRERIQKLATIRRKEHMSAFIDRVEDASYRHTFYRRRGSVATSRRSDRTRIRVTYQSVWDTN